MIALILSIAIAQTPKSTFAVKDFAFQPDAKIVSVLGPKVPGWKHAHGISYDNPAFNKLFVDAAGPGMSFIVIRPKWLAPYPVALKRFGIDASHATVKKLPSPKTAIPLTRNSLEIVGASGVPVSPKTHKPLKVNYIECAIVNKDRTREKRPKILAATGEAKLKLIRECYDWCSELNLRE